MRFLSRLAKRTGRLAKGYSGKSGSFFSLMHLGLTFAASIVFYTLLGMWLDKKLGLLPLFTIVGMLIGATGGFIWIYREVQRAEKQTREQGADETGEASREQPSSRKKPDPVQESDPEKKPGPGEEPE